MNDKYTELFDKIIEEDLKFSMIFAASEQNMSFLNEPERFFKIVTGDEGLNFFYEGIECEMVEVVHPVNTDTYEIFIDESGRLKENKVFNELISAVTSSPIYGKAMITLGVDEEGETVFFQGQDGLHKALAVGQHILTAHSVLNGACEVVGSDMESVLLKSEQESIAKSQEFFESRNITFINANPPQ